MGLVSMEFASGKEHSEQSTWGDVPSGNVGQLAGHLGAHTAAPLPRLVVLSLLRGRDPLLRGQRYCHWYGEARWHRQGARSLLWGSVPDQLSGLPRKSPWALRLLPGCAFCTIAQWEKHVPRVQPMFKMRPERHVLIKEPTDWVREEFSAAAWGVG